MDMRRKHICIMRILCLSATLAVGTVYAQSQVAPRSAQQTGPDCEWAREIGYDNIIYGTDENDAICAPKEDCSWAEMLGMHIIRSTNGDDFICPGHGNDYVNAGDGDDQIWVDRFRKRLDKPGIVGENGFKRLYGGNGDDFITDARNSAYIVGGCGRDILEGGNGNDILYGYLEPGDTKTECPTATDDWDELFGENDNDVLIGGPGQNKLVGGPGYNHCDGTTGVTEFGKGCELCWGSNPKNTTAKGLKLNKFCDNFRPNPN